MKSSRRFWNWKGRFVSTYCANNANHNRSDGCKRYIVHADEKLTAFIELESAISALSLSARVPPCLPLWHQPLGYFQRPGRRTYFRGGRFPRGWSLVISGSCETCQPAR